MFRVKYRDDVELCTIVVDCINVIEDDENENSKILAMSATNSPLALLVYNLSACQRTELINEAFETGKLDLTSYDVVEEWDE